MSAKPNSRPVWDKAEKRFIAVSILTIGFFCGSLLWWGRLNELPDYKIPEPTLPSPNAFDTYLQATFMMAPVTKPAVDPIVDTEEITDPKERANRYSVTRKEAWLKQNAGAFALLRQGLKQQYQQPASRSWSAMFPYFARYRELARRFTIESKTHLLRGKNGAAADSALDTIQFGTQVPRGGPLIAALVGQAMQSMGQRQMFIVLPHLNAIESKSAARRMEKICAMQLPYAQTLREEKWSTQAAMLEILRKPDWASQFASNVGGTPATFWNKWRYSLVGKRRVMDNFTKYMDKTIAEAAKPYAKMQEVPVPDDPVNQMIAPVFSRSRFSFTRGETGSALILVSLCLRVYRLEHGDYPEKLSLLAPNYLQKIPADPFGNGEPLRYKKQGATYKLWSIGPDLKDNNGAPLQQPDHVNRYENTDKTAPRDATTQGDWVIGP